MVGPDKRIPLLVGSDPALEDARSGVGSRWAPGCSHHPHGRGRVSAQSLGGSNRAGRKVATAVGAHAAQSILYTRTAKRALERADAGIGGVGRQVLVTTLAAGPKFEHGSRPRRGRSCGSKTGPRMVVPRVGGGVQKEQRLGSLCSRCSTSAGAPHRRARIARHPHCLPTLPRCRPTRWWRPEPCRWPETSRSRPEAATVTILAEDRRDPPCATVIRS